MKKFQHILWESIQCKKMVVLEPFPFKSSYTYYCLVFLYDVLRRSNKDISINARENTQQLWQLRVSM